MKFSSCYTVAEGSTVRKKCFPSHRARMVFLLAGLCLAGNMHARAARAETGTQPCWLRETVELRAASSGKPASGRLPSPLPPGEYQLKLTLVNSSHFSELCALSFSGEPGLAEIFDGNHEQPLAQTGWTLPLKARTPPLASPTLNLTLAPGEHEFFVRVVVPNLPLKPLTNLQLTVAPFTDLAARQMEMWHVSGIYGGIMLAVVLYNVFLFLALRQRLYLYYVLYATCFGFIWLIRAGVGLHFLWPQQPIWNAMSGFYFILAAVIAGNVFSSNFLNVKQHAPRLLWAFRASSAGALTAGVLGLVGFWRLGERFLAVTALLTCLLYLFAGVKVRRQGVATATFYLAASGLVALGTLVYTFAFLELLPKNAFTVNSAQVGSAAEMVLLAFSLGYRIRELEDEKRRSESGYVKRLEREVQERTVHLEQANQRLAELSLTDSLTGVANRRRWDEHLDSEWRRCIRSRVPLAVVLVDVDHFKLFNDSQGHLAGDHVLRQVAQVLAAVCRRPGDLLARYGGEEFALAFPATDLAEAQELAEVVRTRVQALAIPHPTSSCAPVVTVSCGSSAGMGTQLDELPLLVQNADRALYLAKGAGRNQVKTIPTEFFQHLSVISS